MNHLYHQPMLDAGEHFCIVCKALNSELAPKCIGHEVAPHLRLEQAERNEVAYGPNRWAIVSTIGDDATLTTVVTLGDTVAP